MNHLEIHYPRESAGRLMTPNVPTVPLTATVGDIEQLLLKRAGDFDTINYIYVLDHTNTLKGVLSVKEVFRSPKTTAVKSLIQGAVVSVRAHTDQERVALIALEHGVKAVPVVDKDDYFLGVVPSDVILRALHNESVEDALRFAGAGKFDDPAKSIIMATAWTHIVKRLPWLLLGLGGGVVAAAIVGFFEDALEAQILIAAFIPAIVYMADAVGNQTQTLFIRSLALEHTLDVRHYLWREVRVNMALALALAVVMAGVAWILWSSGMVSLILGISFFLTILIAMVVAMALPWIFFARGKDPAFASGPFATVFRDIVSLLIYFAVATTVLQFFP